MGDAPFGDPVQAGLAAHYRLTKRRENMRLIWLLTGDRLASRHLMLGVETLLALTLCLVVLRTVTHL
jgi:hypothetical protein